MLAAILFAALPLAAQEATQPVTFDQVNKIARELYCPVCPNETLDACQTQACAQWRDEIRSQLAQGQSEQQVIDSFVRRYGDRVLGAPQDPTLRLLSLIAPFLIAVLALIIGVYTFMRWRRRPRSTLEPSARVDACQRRVPRPTGAGFTGVGVNGMSDIDILQRLEGDAPPPRSGISLGALVLLIGVALTVLIFGLALVRQQQGAPTQGPAPDFTVKTFDGNDFTLSAQRGKVVVINFWASWCGPCRDEATAFESLWQQYQNKDVVFLGITFADDPKDSEEFIAQYGMTYPNADDGKSDISKGLYRIQGVPETFVIDKQGNVARYFWSLYLPSQSASTTSSDLTMTPNDLAKLIDQLLTTS